MVVLAAVSLCLLGTYLLVSAVLYGVKDYVSDNYYIGRHPWVFSVVMGVSGALLLPAMMERGGEFRFLALFAVFGLLLVAVEPHYKVAKMHSVGALTALICGVGWVATFHPALVGGVVLAWFAYWLAKLPRPYYVGEVAAFGLIYGNLLLNEWI